MSAVSRASLSFPVRQPTTLYRDHFKHVLDVLIVVLMVPAYLPLILLLILITRRDGGSGLFGHERVGRSGKVFRCWKIRTMVPNAAEVLERHLAEDANAAIEWARDHKLSNDPRITPVGRVLRATSLDELPQLWNVFRGEMSLVGPRPVTGAELVRYRGFETHYFSVPPGITGLW